MRVPQYSRFYLALPVVLLLGACTTVPTGPSVMVLPGTGMSLERFRADEAWCREDALRQIGGQSASDNQRQATLNSAAIGTAIGTVAGGRRLRCLHQPGRRVGVSDGEDVEGGRVS